jgi:hypothetical protein
MLSATLRQYVSTADYTLRQYYWHFIAWTVLPYLLFHNSTINCALLTENGNTFIKNEGLIDV